MNLKALLQQYLPKLIELISQWMAKPQSIRESVSAPTTRPVNLSNAPLQLKRLQCTAMGIFSELLDGKGNHICFTAEHAFGG